MAPMSCWQSFLRSIATDFSRKICGEKSNQPRLRYIPNFDLKNSTIVVAPRTLFGSLRQPWPLSGSRMQSTGTPRFVRLAKLCQASMTGTLVSLASGSSVQFCAGSGPDLACACSLAWLQKGCDGVPLNVANLPFDAKPRQVRALLMSPGSSNGPAAALECAAVHGRHPLQ